MMNEERPDISLLIGLHKLAEQNGDGMVPELYAVLAARGDADPVDRTNIVAMRPSRTSMTGLFKQQGARIMAFRR